MPSNLTQLVCGASMPESESELAQILYHLRITLETTVQEVEGLKNLSEQKISFYGPFLGRSILELCCTAIIARIDPFRVLLLREIQSRSDYKIGQRNKISIQWQGDVLAEKKIQDLWTEKSIENAMSTRPLLGDYYEHIFWKNSIERLVDNVPQDRGGQWMVDLRKIPPDGFCSFIRGKFQELYSSLSKGIHHEFVIPTESILDRATVCNLIGETLYVVASLGLALTMMPHIPLAIELDAAISCYENIQELEID